MAGMNKVQIIGRLGQDPELKKTPGGSACCNFSVAVSEKYKDKTTGQMNETTEWFNVVLWNKSAENAAQYLRKGSQVYIEGKQKTNSWDDNGVKKSRVQLQAMSFLMLDSRGDSNGGGYNQPQQQQSQPTDDSLPF